MPQFGFISIFISLTLFLTSKQRTLTKKPAKRRRVKSLQMEMQSLKPLQIFASIISLQSDAPSNLYGNSDHGPEFEELENDAAHEGQTQDLNPSAIINSNHSNNLSSATSLPNNSSNTVTLPNLTAPPEISVPQVNPAGPNVTSMPSHSHTISMPMAPSASPPHEDNKLFAVFAVELLGALTNLAASSKRDHNQVLFYAVVACSTFAFSISSTALVLHKKWPRIAEKMQKAAFSIVIFGFMGIMGMLLPSTISWYFTIPAFLVCVMIALASLIQ